NDGTVEEGRHGSRRAAVVLQRAELRVDTQQIAARGGEAGTTCRIADQVVALGGESAEHIGKLRGRAAAGNDCVLDLGRPARQNNHRPPVTAVATKTAGTDDGLTADFGSTADNRCIRQNQIAIQKVDGPAKGRPDPLAGTPAPALAAVSPVACVAGTERIGN